jgi:hypothetical protein
MNTIFFMTLNTVTVNNSATGQHITEWVSNHNTWWHDWMFAPVIDIFSFTIADDKCRASWPLIHKLSDSYIFLNHKRVRYLIIRSQPTKLLVIHQFCNIWCVPTNSAFDLFWSKFDAPKAPFLTIKQKHFLAKRSYIYIKEKQFSSHHIQDKKGDTHMHNHSNWSYSPKWLSHLKNLRNQIFAVWMEVWLWSMQMKDYINVEIMTINVVWNDLMNLWCSSQNSSFSVFQSDGIIDLFCKMWQSTEVSGLTQKFFCETGLRK